MIMTFRALLGTAAIACGAIAAATTFAAVPFRAGGVMIDAPVQSLAERRFQNVVRQAHDVSCGAAALATLLRHFYDEEVNERDVIEAMLELGDIEKIQQHGFSMLELKRFAEHRGFVSAGYRIEDVSDLLHLKVPAITLVSTKGYKHFVVIKNVYRNHVLIADPAFGNRAQSLDDFSGQWDNVILLVLSQTNNGKPEFSQAGVVMAPIDEVQLLIHRGVPPIRPLPGEF